jgi:hypothetical protein
MSFFAGMVLRLESRSIDGDQSNERNLRTVRNAGSEKDSTIARKEA